MRKGPLPVVALTGFLGSGKTTLLKHWLRDAPVEAAKSVLIINDFGPVNIDAALLAGLPYELRSIAGGCVCCTSYGELIDQLDELSAQDVEMVWLETSGLAEPEEVLDHLTDPQLRGKVAVRRLVQVIDAANYPGSWRHRAVEESQVRFADILVINKADLVDAGRLDKLQAQLRALNPGAEIVICEQGRAEARTLWSPAASALQPAQAESGESCCCCCGGHEEEDEGPAASVHFHPLDVPLSRSRLGEMIRALPQDVMRAKGVVRLAESPDRLHVFQYVHGQGEPLVVPLDPVPEPVPQTGLVLIGPRLDPAMLNGLLS